MSAEHNHRVFCCCHLEIDQGRCPACPERRGDPTAPETPPPPTREQIAAVINRGFVSNPTIRLAIADAVLTLLSAATPYTEQETTNG